MKMIEGKIQDILLEHHECRWMDTSELENCLRKITTEQKSIDIEKAIKAHCSFCEAHNACVDRGGFCCPETEHIKKTMEE